MKYRGVIGFGRAVFIDNLNEKRNALSFVMFQYAKRKFEFPEKMLKTMAVIKMEIKNLTGKQSGF